MDATVQVQQISEPYVNEFTRLENNHGWAKAELLARWRRETKATDEEIADAIGEGMRGQTVCRMRRVWEDFSVERSLYRNLSFSHFLEALAWDDAEAWLKDANGKGWSVAEMRERRQQSTAPHTDKPSKPARKAEPEEEDDNEVSEPLAEEGEEAEETEKAKATPAKSEKPKQKTTDIIGQNIPVHLRDIFETSRLLLDAESDLQKLATEIAATATDDIGDKNPIIGNRLSVIKNHIENAKREIRFCAPHVVCPMCKGSGCSGCRAKGWHDKDTWNAIKGS